MPMPKKRGRGVGDSACRSFYAYNAQKRTTDHEEDRRNQPSYARPLPPMIWSLTMTPTITAFERSPDRGKGLARDMRVRWALEEVGQPYDVRLVSFSAMKEPAHLARHPFGQIPTYEEGDLVLFESGRSCSISRSAMRACCLKMRMRGRARSHGCSPRSTRWSRRSSIAESPCSSSATSPGTSSACLSSRIASAKRLGELSRRLGDADWLDGAFSAGDLLMVRCCTG